MQKMERELKKIINVSYDTGIEYSSKQEILVQEVNQTLSLHKNIGYLIGNNPLAVMEDNHQNHANFMSNVFKMNQHSLFLQIVPWVYRSYKARGFSYDYFPVAYQAWISAVANNLEPHLATPIIKIYQWLADNHLKLIELSQSAFSVPDIQPEAAEPWKDLLDSFLQALLQGDHRTCLDLAYKTVNSRAELENFYMYVLQTSMYRIGSMWEEGKTSVAHEHLASAIVSRVMASLYPRFLLLEETKGKAVITASPNEFHEIGARMVADFLEIDGWDVKYLGANVPELELIKMLAEDHPFMLGVSVAMPFNIDNTQAMIKKIRGIETLKDMKIMVGGKIFSENPHLWEVTGADEWAMNGKDAITIASAWQEGQQ